MVFDAFADAAEKEDDGVGKKAEAAIEATMMGMWKFPELPRLAFYRSGTLAEQEQILTFVRTYKIGER